MAIGREGWGRRKTNGIVTRLSPVGLPFQAPRSSALLAGGWAPLGAVLAGSAVVASLLAAPHAAHAGLLTPVLQLMRPQLETKLAQVCVESAGRDSPELRQSLREPCHQLAIPTSRCLIEETDSSGRGLGVLSELVAGRFGNDSEVVVKRCLARLFGLPADSLREVPLRDLGRRFGSLQPGKEAP